MFGSLLISKIIGSSAMYCFPHVWEYSRIIFSRTEAVQVNGNQQTKQMGRPILSLLQAARARDAAASGV
jgi:hypothetical protein